MANSRTKADKEYLQYWAYCRYDLGLSDEEIKGLTAPQFNELKKRRNANVEMWTTYLTKTVGLVSFMLYLVNTPTASRKYSSLEDFLGIKSNKPQSVEGLAAAFEAAVIKGQKLNGK